MSAGFRLPTGYGDYRDPTDTAAWEHAVEMLTRDALPWACPCGSSGAVDGTIYAAGWVSQDDRPDESGAEVAMASDGSPVWSFACPGCGSPLEVDEEGTR